MNYIGVDPGKKGAVCLLDKKNKILELEDLPLKIERIVKGKPKTVIDAKKLLNIIYCWQAEHGNIVCAFIEDIHSMGGKAAASMWSLGNTLGAIKAVISCEDIPIIFITPKHWRTLFNLIIPKSTDAVKKESSRQRVLKLYPHQKHLFNRKKDSDRAESILIARCGIKSLKSS